MWQNKWSSPTQRRLPFFESKIRTRRFHSSLHYFLITIYTHKTSSATQQSLYLFPNYLLLVIHQPFQCWKADKAKQIRIEVPFDLRTLFHPSPYQQVRSHYLSLEMLPCKQNSCLSFSLRKQTTFREPPTFSQRKWRLRKDSRNSILMTRHYTYLGSDASSVWPDFCACFSDVISRGNCFIGVAKCLFSRSCSCFTPCELILDGLGISILGREFWIPGTGFQSSSLGFRISWAVFRIPKSRISDFTSKNFPDSEIQILSQGPTCCFMEWSKLLAC